MFQAVPAAAPVTYEVPELAVVPCRSASELARSVAMILSDTTLRLRAWPDLKKHGNGLSD